MATDPRRRSRGQVLIIFSLTIFVFVGLCAVVVDVAWYWANNLRIQRAADAAALAGVVHLPGDPTTAYAVARSEATKNGYTSGVDGFTVTPIQDPVNNRRLEVTISGQVGTYFSHVLGVHEFAASRQSRAEFVLPVPMGSPEAYYGTFGLVRHPGGGVDVPGNTAWFRPTSAPSGNWTNPSNAYVANESPTQLYATRADAASPYQQYGTFGISIPAGATIRGIELALDAYSADSAGCALRFEVSRTAGSSWSAVGSGSQVALTGTEASLTSPASGGSSYLWGLSSWTSSHLTNANFRVRVQYYDPGASCSAPQTAYLEHIAVRVHYTTFSPDTNLTNPYGGAVNARGFWGTMHNPGSADVDGDAYLPRWETIGTTPNDQYDPGGYYDYAVELGPGTSNGEVWVYDPVFCAGGGPDVGTGDRWFGGNR
ncbi:MAG TPA: pilus assembly protein TadG-related protein, partial [Candidatus Limnocylindrales bacterium]|nr:pilus assembly protein TadG-related protein [Candidatus Limnocylindrales bacterium]